MHTTPAVALVDWGLETLDLWLVSRGGTVIAAHSSPDGLASGRRDGFSAVLESNLASVDAAGDLPVIICGMAGSRQGWRQTSYLETPVDLGILAEKAIFINGSGRRVALLPGIAQTNSGQPDVMRGDEVRLFGAILESNGAGICCLPGLHSKWVRLTGRQVQGFRTFMTGELRQAIARSTILKFSIDPDAPISADDPAYLTGVRDGWLNAGRLTHLLFSLRADELLHGRSGAENLARLAGLLIGAEIAGADLAGSPTVTLVASGEDARLYLAAFDTCGINARLVDAELSTQRGLYEIWQSLEGAQGS